MTGKFAISPISTDFIKADKKYPVKELRDTGFTIDKNDLEMNAESDMYCSYRKCAHLKERNWKIV